MRTEDLPVVECIGTPRERGRAHGEALRTVIAAKVERWEEAIGIAYGESASQFLPRFLAETDFRRAITAHTPDLTEEVKGIAEGAGLPENTTYLMQLMDEEWWFGRALAAAHCSSIVIPPANGRPTLVGQTMDLPRWHDGAQALLRFTDDGSERIVFTSAGMIGLMGVSSRGLGVCVNTLWQLPTDPKGLPVAYAMRGSLAYRNVADASAFLKGIPHASGQNYQLGDRSEARTLECSAAGTRELEVGDRSLHTNHPLAHWDTDLLKEHYPTARTDSHARLESLQSDLSNEACTRPAAEDVRHALSACRPDSPVAIAPEAGASLTANMTVGAVVYEIGEQVSLSVCAGPPGREGWKEITLPSA